MTASNETQYELRVELDAFEGEKVHAVHHEFGVCSEDDGYRLIASYFADMSWYCGAGDNLKYSVGEEFSTPGPVQDLW